MEFKLSGTELNSSVSNRRANLARNWRSPGRFASTLVRNDDGKHFQNAAGNFVISQPSAKFRLVRFP